MYVNPFAGRKNIFDWAAHRKAGYQGGDDYKTKIGEPVRSPAAGWATRMEDGLNGIRITTPDGNSAVIRELASNVGYFPREVLQLEQIGTAGLFRAGEFKATHIEGWMNGVRVPFAQLQKSYTRRAGVKRIGAYLNARARQLGLPQTTTERTGVRGPRYWRLVQTWGRTHGLYGLGYRINGRPGPKTRQIEAHLATIAK